MAQEKQSILRVYNQERVKFKTFEHLRRHRCKEMTSSFQLLDRPTATEATSIKPGNLMCPNLRGDSLSPSFFTPLAHQNQSHTIKQKNNFLVYLVMRNLKAKNNLLNLISSGPFKPSYRNKLTNYIFVAAFTSACLCVESRSILLNSKPTLNYFNNDTKRDLKNTDCKEDKSDMNESTEKWKKNLNTGHRHESDGLLLIKNNSLNNQQHSNYHRVFFKRKFLEEELP
ncbi:hypothetical protein BY996DRAFT_4342242 [Phakopsora pachyrhizi]|nr:hypothetical protein BY996DRAFT_2703160 [Phakopsora pachyrhizi]KAI8450002.1 hypothetical protein BY996DRAFT_4342242 [Phakopsora pachyrhizi]